MVNIFVKFHGFSPIHLPWYSFTLHYLYSIIFYRTMTTSLQDFSVKKEVEKIQPLTKASDRVPLTHSIEMANLSPIPGKGLPPNEGPLPLLRVDESEDFAP
ncbi:hypothetical protein JEQ21_08865 [Streptococcus sp. 121]|uniref:hypothetical protein n=1 Tax=Streptococcus sp. 121 TaxID=2797637 RepID=UPI0018F0C1E4|nr:hypothetical protein [Streptococcus sp. 121]MBJ6746548.1 hypothetical protein [Streptococcus sp. 121]